AYRPARDRVADDQLPFPRLIEEVIPILRRLVRLHDFLGIEKGRRRLVGREVEITGATPACGDGVGPVRAPAIEQRVARGLRKNERRTAEPHLRLRFLALGTD